MKKLLLMVAMGTMAASLALAVDQTCASVLAASGANWQSLLSLDGTAAPTCHIGNLDFSGFSFTPGGTISEPASSVGVSLLTTPGNEGFRFNPAISNATPPDAANTSEDVELDFNVTALNGNTIDDLGIFFNGSVTGTGTSTFSETETGAGWVGPPPCGGPTCVFMVTNPPVNLGPLEEVFTTPVTSLHIVKDIGSNTGTAGTVSISDVENTFSNAPEPRLVSILMLGLLAGLGLSKKFRSVLS